MQEIEYILSKNNCTNQYFLGCVELHNLIDFVKRNFDLNKEKIIIVVLLYEGGYPPRPDQIGHYILLFWQKVSTKYYNCILFDSFKPEFDVNTRKILKSVLSFSYTKSLRSNSLTYQSPFSCVCGLYSIVVAVLLCRGKTLEAITELFSSENKQANDRFVYKFVKKYFPVLNSTRLLDCDGVF